MDKCLRPNPTQPANPVTKNDVFQPRTFLTHYPTYLHLAASSQK